MSWKSQQWLAVAAQHYVMLPEKFNIFNIDRWSDGGHTAWFAFPKVTLHVITSLCWPCMQSCGVHCFRSEHTFKGIVSTKRKILSPIFMPLGSQFLCNSLHWTQSSYSLSLVIIEFLQQFFQHKSFCRQMAVLSCGFSSWPYYIYWFNSSSVVSFHKNLNGVLTHMGVNS